MCIPQIGHFSPSLTVKRWLEKQDEENDKNEDFLTQTVTDVDALSLQMMSYFTQEINKS